jgi:hypothetical protein
MRSFHDPEKNCIGGRPCKPEDRLPLGASALLIGLLSACSWAVLISIAMVFQIVGLR